MTQLAEDWCSLESLSAIGSPTICSSSGSESSNSYDAASSLSCCISVETNSGDLDRRVVVKTNQAIESDVDDDANDNLVQNNQQSQTNNKLNQTITNNQQQQTLSTITNNNNIVIVPPTVKQRRFSRIEHRQSLSDAGYGKLESYVRLQRLGKGTYATVYMGRSRLSNELVALKEITKEHDEGAPCTAIREVSLLRFLRHNNIITLHDICHTPTKLTLVFEYVGPDLYTYIRQNNYLLSMHNVKVSAIEMIS